MNRPGSLRTLLVRRVLLFPITILLVLALVFTLAQVAASRDAGRLASSTFQGRLQEKEADRLFLTRERHLRHLPVLWNRVPLHRDSFSAGVLRDALPSSEARGTSHISREVARAALRSQGRAAVPVLRTAWLSPSLSLEDRAFVTDRLRDLGVLERSDPDHVRERLAAFERKCTSRDRAAFLLRVRRSGELLPSDRELGEVWLEDLVLACLTLEDDPQGERNLLAAVHVLRGDPPPALEDDASLAAARRNLHTWWSLVAYRFRAARPLDPFTRLRETRFATWLLQTLRFDFGRDRDGLRVQETLVRRLRVTLPLMATALFLAFLLAPPLGIYLALRKGKFLTALVTIPSHAVYCMPRFCLGLLLLTFLAAPGPLGVFASSYGGISFTGAEGWLERTTKILKRDTLPILTLMLPPLVYIARHVRAALLETLAQPHVQAARARGLSERRVLYRHALLPACMPFITLFGAALPALVGGSVVVEYLFEIPGVGRYALAAMFERDVPVLMAVTLLSAAVTLFGLLCSEVLYVLVDPRIARARGE